MGYKLAGFDVVGNCEIDRDMERVYLVNNHPKYTYNMDIRDFRALPDSEIPEEVRDLDVLDGSPPCSVFSMAGGREAGWGREKVFREGQERQRLDDLFFEYIALAKRLRPKVVVAENVKGLLLGNAKGYVAEILAAFREAGYSVQVFLLDSSRMGVPQRRERVFFIAHRCDLPFQKLTLEFKEKRIPFGMVRSEHGDGRLSDHERMLMDNRRDGDSDIGCICTRMRQKTIGYNSKIFSDNDVALTLTSAGGFYRMCDGTRCCRDDFVAVQTFPQDYDFLDQSPQYVCGMSVPPVMMAQIARRIGMQWLGGRK